MQNNQTNKQPQSGGKPRLPPWIRVRAAVSSTNYRLVHDSLRSMKLNTVCESALCPNRLECFNHGTATVMILGDVCTRDCRFCAVTHGKPGQPDLDEPRRVKELAVKLGLRYVVVTSVTRDDLADGGAEVFAQTIRLLQTAKSPTDGKPVKTEVLTPDFKGDESAIAVVLKAEPDVFNHNLETVKSLQKSIRPQADYQRSLNVLKTAQQLNPDLLTKSGLMLGLGETEEEIHEALEDLLEHGCKLLTLGQYLSPSKTHYHATRYVTPKEFEDYRELALKLGFLAVASGPLVRSSYQADQLALVARQSSP